MDISNSPSDRRFSWRTVLVAIIRVIIPMVVGAGGASALAG